MAKISGVRWLCPSRDCRWSMVSTVIIQSDNAPRCVCGEVMQQIEPAPVMSYLEFLRGDMELAGSVTEKD